MIGSPTRARTWDLRINSPSLYQLSYRGTEAEKNAYFSFFDSGGSIRLSVRESGVVDDGVRCGAAIRR